MTDIFISYAHEDQPFVRRVAEALETEGFSVWWDHTIPPGKSWDTFIARGIEEARCCIVVWSEHSVASDWVKEEATLAKAKLLPVQFGVGEPPVGFRRIQAANLSGWNGDRGNAQWQLLVREARNLVNAAGAGGRPVAAVRDPYPTSPAPKGNKPPWAILAGGAFAVILGAVAFLLFSNPTTPPQAPAAETMTSVEEPTFATTPEAQTPAPNPVATTTRDPPDVDRAELERLRRERDDALSSIAARDAAERERLERERTASAIPSAQGLWRGTVYFADGQSATTTWTLNADGSFMAGDNIGGSWSQNGATVVLRYNTAAAAVYTGTITGDAISGTFRNASDRTGTFSWTR